MRASPPRERRAHQHGSSRSVSEVQRWAPLAGGLSPRTREAWGAAERGRGQDASPFGVGLAAGVEARRERASKLGRCLTVARGFDRPQRAGGSWVLEPRHRSSGLANVARRLSSRWQTRSGIAPVPRVSARETGPGSVRGHTLEGTKAQESTGVSTSPWPGQGVTNERTPGGSKASKRACRPLTGEPGWIGMGGRIGHTPVCPGRPT